jgi:hypothetical protein
MMRPGRSGPRNSEKCHEGFDPVRWIRDRLDRRWRPYQLVLYRARNIPSNWHHRAAGNVFLRLLVVSWIATVFVMDGSLKSFKAERDPFPAAP